MNKEFKKLCTPAKIYFAIAVLASIISLIKGASYLFIISKLIFALFWTYILGWLCKKGFVYISWALVLLPYIIIALAFFKIYQVTEDQRAFLKMLKLQGAYGQEQMTNPNPVGNANPNPVEKFRSRQYYK